VSQTLYAACLFAECRYAMCHFAEWCGAAVSVNGKPKFLLLMRVQKFSKVIVAETHLPGRRFF